MESRTEKAEVHLGMKNLSVANWSEPEVPKHFSGFSEAIWVSRILEPKLTASVPETVVALFEVARGSMLYGWFFYPLLTLAAEQFFRVQEAAIRARCELAGIPTEQVKKGKATSRRLVDLISDLTTRKIIPSDSVTQWDASRNLRNWTSHPKRQMIIPPGIAIAEIDLTARLINQLFEANQDYLSSLGVRIRRATGLDCPERILPVVAGIDVGGSRKGYHLVALRGATVQGTKTTLNAVDAAQWCQDQGATLVGVDAPSRWSLGEGTRSRKAERELATSGYSTHATPTRETAKENPFYGWMFNGEALYTALQSVYPLFKSEGRSTRFCFETYPYLAACAFTGRRLKAADKNADRRELIRGAGLDDQVLRSIDYVDAAICALVAFSVSLDYCTAFGEDTEGYILSPPLL